MILKDASISELVGNFNILLPSICPCPQLHKNIFLQVCLVEPVLTIIVVLLGGQIFLVSAAEMVTSKSRIFPLNIKIALITCKEKWLILCQMSIGQLTMPRIMGTISYQMHIHRFLLELAREMIRYILMVHLFIVFRTHKTLWNARSFKFNR